MLAIITRRIPATNKRPTRVVAVAGRNRLVIPLATDDYSEYNAPAVAVKRLCAKMGWEGQLYVGDLFNGGQVWVWTSTTMGVVKTMKVS